MSVAMKPAKLTDGTGTRKTHTDLLALMGFEIHSVRSSRTSEIGTATREIKDLCSLTQFVQR
jgi:hypothetical protein